MALSAGFKKSKGEIVITMDADLQDDPNEILALYKMINEDAFSKWTKEQLKNFNELSDERKVQVTFTIAKQMGKKNYNLTQLGYYNNK